MHEINERLALLAGLAAAALGCRRERPFAAAAASDAPAPPRAEATSSHREVEMQTATAPAASSEPPHGPDMRVGFAQPGHVGAFAWDDVRWERRCRGVRTSYNPDSDLRNDALTLRPSDPRWLDFVFWTLQNKVNEHQLEAYGGTGWNGPKGGVIFHWAPGSHWERDIVHSWAFFIGHVVGEHRWTDTMFPDFFERYGGVYGVNGKDRLAEIDPRSIAPWIAFLAYAGGADSPNFRYLLHIDSSIDVVGHQIALTAGQGVAFDYSFERYWHELAMILTDCKAVDFFEMYDRFGAGFAAAGDWANQRMPRSALSRVGFAAPFRFAPGFGGGGATPGATPPTAPAPVDVPAGLPEADRMRRGRAVYFAECTDCHGTAGDGAGFLAEGFDVKPRDFRGGVYEFRSTTWGQLPTIEDVERSVRDGIAGTTMPAWGQFLTNDQIGDVARYLVVFSPRFTAAWKDGRRPERLDVGAVPADLRRLAPRGEGVWHLHQCAWCHGDDGRGDGRSAPGLTDVWGQPVRPADLTYEWSFKNGHRPEDVYRTIFGGLNGTPMQSYLAGVPDVRDRWALVAYVLSLSPATRPVLHLADFARDRATRLGADGHVLPAPAGDP